MSQADQARLAAARAALDRLPEDGVVGLGSGRAVNAVIALAAERWPAGPPALAVVASTVTEAHAREAGFTVVDLDELAEHRPEALHIGRPVSGGERPAALLDLVVDGADEVDPRLDLLKGGGGALLRERLVALAAARRLIVVEDEKLVDRLGERHGLPVEIVRFAWRETRERVLRLLPSAVLRVGDDATPFVTDEGHYLLDCELPAGGASASGSGAGVAGVGGGERDPSLTALAAALESLPGVVDHGLFLGLADEVLVGRADGSAEVLTRP